MNPAKGDHIENRSSASSHKSTDKLQAGTGFMLDLSSAIRHFEGLGYNENFVPSFDHLSCRSGAVKVEPKDIVVDKIVRFDNTSDPDDQAILYAISSPSRNLKGLYVDSYGTYHDEIAPELVAALAKETEKSV